MTLAEQLKVLDNKIKANQAQYGLDRLAVKISALSSGSWMKLHIKEKTVTYN